MADFLVDGTLTGMNRQADCKVLLHRDPIAHPQSWTDFMVVMAPKELPDGAYRISFDGYTGYTQKLDGLWLLKNGAIKTNSGTG